MTMERIAIPTENNSIYQHFGKTRCFTIVEAENGTIRSARMMDTDGAGHSALGGFLKNAGVDTLICGGIGQGARDILRENGIKLISGAQGGVTAAVQAYLDGVLADSPEGACDHHHTEDCGEAHQHGCK